VRPRTLLILLALVVGLLLFIRYYERDLPSSDERAVRAKKILTVKKDEVTGVTLEAGNAVVALQRVSAGGAGKEAEWRLTRPLVSGADVGAVDRLLDTLTALELTRELGKVEPRTVGLAPPRGRIVMRTAAGETVVRIGAAVPTGGELIAQVSGPAGKPGIYAVGDTLWSEVQRPIDEWRDRRIVHVDRDRIERVAMWHAGGPRLLLARRGESFWLESPIADRADREKVDKLLGDLTGLSAEKFAGGPAAAAPALGLTPPSATVEVVIGGQAQPLRVELGAPQPEPPPPPPAAGAPPPAPPAGTLRWMRAAGQTFVARTALAEAVDRDPAAWRSLSLAGVEVHQVEAVMARDAKGTTAFTRSGPDWKRAGVTISYLPVSELLFALVDARAARLLSPAEAQQAGMAAKPELTFELKTQAGPETISLYPALSTGEVPARVSGRESVLVLAAGKLKDMGDKLAAARTEKPLPVEKPAKR
jgi:hypothetical protein